MISSIETSDLLQMEEMDISAISISFDETDMEPKQNINPGDDSRPSEQPCTPDLTFSAIECELSLRPEKLDEYRRDYVNNYHFFNDSICMTWKRFKDRCAVHEKYGVKNQAGTSKSLHELTNSTPVTSVLVKDNAAMEKQPLNSCQTSVQENSTQSAVRILDF